MMLCEWQGRLWLRMGDCNRCGECCLGWGKGPCPHLVKHDYDKFECSIHEQLASTPILEGWANPPACAAWPTSPGDLSHLAFQNKCGFFFVPVPRILVACPTYDGKEYCAEKWLKAVKALDYPAEAITVLWVDNSETPGFYERWRRRAPMERLELSHEDPMRRIALSMEHIRRRFLAGSYDRWFNLEADVIVPPETIKTMLGFDRGWELDWLGMSYPRREDQEPGYAAFGCTMFSRRIAERHGFADCAAGSSPDGWWWHHKVKMDPDMRVAEYWGVLQLDHLNA